MSIPLVQNNEKDSINTSIIAIKRQIERINALLGLSNSEEIDTSVFATKTELEDAVTQVETDLAPVDEVTADNMQSVTSNAVAVALDGRTFKHKTVKGTTNSNGVMYKSISGGTLTGKERIVNAYVSNFSNYFCLTGWSNNIAGDGKIVGQEIMVINYDYTKVANTYVEIEIIYF